MRVQILRGEHDAAEGIGRRALTGAAIGLVLVGILLTLFEFVVLRREFTRSADTLARITGIHSAAAIVFHDATAAQETLVALEVLPHLEAIAIFDETGARLADYERSGESPVTAAKAGADVKWYERITQSTITVDGKPVGTIVGRFELTPLFMRLAAFAGMYVFSGFGVLAIGFPLWRRMRKQVELAQTRLTRLAHYDPTTGQLNRNAFNRDLKAALECCAQGSRVGLFILDIDDFKDINDRFGHRTGDDLLNQFAERLGRAVRSEDCIYRLGGDEFAVLVQPLASAAEANHIAERLFVPFTSAIALNGHRLHAAFSAGVSIYPDDAADMETLVAHADKAMYHAKQRGKNTFQRFEPYMTESMLRRLRLQEDLRDALGTDTGLALAYQPQMRADGITIIGMEALLRWDHPELGVISPSEFIPLAEDCGLIAPLGNWVLRKACAQAARWHAAGYADLHIAVNVSVRQMQDRGLLGAIDEALAESKLEPSALELEITESLLLEDAEANTRFMHSLRERGIGLAIDDFGKGYSSMSYLHRLPVDRLKIDMSFVHDIPGSGEVITTAIIAMAHSLGLTVVAEGVETPTQLNFLRAAGCDGVQGFLVGAPLSAAAAAVMLEKQRRLHAEHHGSSKALSRISQAERSTKTLACDFALQAKVSDVLGLQPRFAKSASRSSVS